MADQLHLSARHRGVLEALLHEHLPNVEAWAYGSRVNGRSHDGSDLDLVLRAPGLTKIPAERLADFKDAVCESTIPFLVEARDWARLPERFQHEIARDHVLLNDSALSRAVDGPQDIQFAKLLSEPVRNGLYKTKQFHGRGVKVVNMGELFAHPRLRDVPMRRVELTDSEKSRFCVSPGDLLFARRSLVAKGAGKCCVVLETPEPTAFESSIIRARPNAAKADSLFLYYYFNSPTGLHSLDTIRRQVAVAGITGTDLANLAIRLPPVAEQRAIAGILGALDDKVELNRSMNDTLESMARALFKSWFVDFDPVRAKMEERDCGLPTAVADLFPAELADCGRGPIPTDWQSESLGNCFNLTMGQSPPGTSYNEAGNGLPFFQGRKDFGFRHPVNRRFCTAPSRIARSGDTLVSVRAPVGDINMASTDSCVGRGVAAIRHCSGSPTYTFYAISAIRRQIAEFEHTGTVFGAITGKQFAALPVIEPDLDVVRAFETLAEPFDRRISLNIAESRTLTRLRDVLLTKLVSGEIRVQQAEDAVTAAL